MSSSQSFYSLTVNAMREAVQNYFAPLKWLVERKKSERDEEYFKSYYGIVSAFADASNSAHVGYESAYVFVPIDSAINNSAVMVYGTEINNSAVAAYSTDIATHMGGSYLSILSTSEHVFPVSLSECTYVLSVRQSYSAFDIAGNSTSAVEIREQPVLKTRNRIANLLMSQAA